MRQNSTKLSSKKRRVIAQILAGESITNAAKAVKIDRTSIYKWFHNDPEFRDELSRQSDLLQSQIQNRLISLANKATDAIESALEEGDAKIALSVLKGLCLLTSDRPVNQPIAIANQHSQISYDTPEPITDEETIAELTELVFDPEIKELLLSNDEFVNSLITAAEEKGVLPDVLN